MPGVMLARSLALALPILGSCLIAPAAAADTLSSNEALVETAHSATLRMMRGHAELVVRRTFRNDEERSEQAMLSLDLPEGAVGTSLRTLAIEGGKPSWVAADLLEASAAASKYASFQGPDGHGPRPSALLACGLAKASSRSLSLSGPSP